MYPLGHGSGEKVIYYESDETIFICTPTLGPFDSIEVHWIEATVTDLAVAHSSRE